MRFDLAFKQAAKNHQFYKGNYWAEKYPTSTTERKYYDLPTDDITNLLKSIAVHPEYTTITVTVKD